MGISHGFVNANGLRLHHVDFGGSGTPIVLGHGVTGHAWVWSGVADRLVEVGRVVSLDYRGFGDSQWSAEQAYTTDDHLADLEAVIGSLGASEVDLVGSSWGGLVSLAYAARHPGAVRRLALVDVAPSSTQGQDEVPPMAYDFADHAEVVAAERAANPNAPDEMIEIAARYGTRPGEGGRLYRKRDPYLMTRWPFRADDRWEELSGLDLPVLVVHAAQSFIPGEVAERMAKETGGTLVEIDPSGHVVPLENPSDLADALVSFLSDRA
jgi:pimeloyl-ACP methyl ester carboxylesterase